MLVIVAPGQGAQTPGFLTPWLEDPTFAGRFGWLSTVAGLDLAHYGTEADAETIRDTAIAQPLLVATGLVAALELFPHPADAFERVGAVAGHSVGELTAAAGARVITAEQAMVLVRERGNAMAEAAAVTPTSMTAVLGGDRDEVLAALAEHGLTPANDNGPGQIVAAGTVEQLAGARRRPARQGPADPAERRRRLPHRAHGARRRPPRPAGPRRSRPTTRAPAVISNRDGQVVHDGRDVLGRIVGQIANPVRWDLCMDTMLDLGVTGILEMPPAGTLTGIAKRALKGVETSRSRPPTSSTTPACSIAKHGEPRHRRQPDLADGRLPAKGTFHLSAEAADARQPAAATAIGEVAACATAPRHRAAQRRDGRVAGAGRRPRSPPASR